MNFLIVSKNNSFSNSITDYLTKLHHHTKIGSTVFEVVNTILENDFQAVIIDKEYITLSSYDLFIFAYSKKLRPLLLFINTENFTPSMISRYKKENSQFFKLQIQCQKSEKAYTVFNDYLNVYLDSFNTLLDNPLRKKEINLISVIFKNRKPTSLIKIAEFLWEDLNTKNIAQHKKTLYSYISRINSFCTNNEIIQIRLNNSKGKYSFQPNQLI